MSGVSEHSGRNGGVWKYLVVALSSVLVTGAPSVLGSWIAWGRDRVSQTDLAGLETELKEEIDRRIAAELGRMPDRKMFDTWRTDQQAALAGVRKDLQEVSERVSEQTGTMRAFMQLMRNGAAP